MKHFYAGTFMNKEELEKEGIFYPIKLEYYKIKEMEKNTESYGVEIIKTSYQRDRVKIEKESASKITLEEEEVNKMLDLLKRNEVTPSQLEFVIHDTFYEEEIMTSYMGA